MNILLIHNYYKTPGGECSTFDRQMQDFKKEGHNVIVYSRDNKETDKFSILDKLLFPFYCIYSLKTVRDLEKIIKKRKPDLAIIQNIFPLISPSAYFVLKKHNIKVIQYIQAYRLLCINGMLFRKGRICEKCSQGNYYGFIHKCYKQSPILSFIMFSAMTIHNLLGTFKNKIDEYVSISKFVTNKLLENGFNKDKITLKTHTDYFPKKKVKRLKGDYFVYLGRLSYEKGVFIILEAAKLLPKVKIKIAGSGELHKKIKGYIEKNDLSNVELMGYIKGDKKINVLKKAKALIVPSIWYEPSTIVIPEALSFGVPVIGSDIGGIPKLLKDKKDCFLFKAGDHKALADIMNRF